MPHTTPISNSENILLLFFLNRNLYINEENMIIIIIDITKFAFFPFTAPEPDPRINIKVVCKSTYNESSPKILGVKILLLVIV